MRTCTVVAAVSTASGSAGEAVLRDFLAGNISIRHQRNTQDRRGTFFKRQNRISICYINTRWREIGVIYLVSGGSGRLCTSGWRIAPLAVLTAATTVAPTTDCSAYRRIGAVEVPICGLDPVSIRAAGSDPIDGAPMTASSIFINSSSRPLLRVPHDKGLSSIHTLSRQR
jgi:hypothetical protein